MEIYRNILSKLAHWKNSPYRKPLVLQGARQVGKSFVLKQFGEQSFDDYCYVNFDFEKEHIVEFERTKDPKRLISYLSAVKGINISAQTLLIFDEIQECPEALNSLKYFCELLPTQAVVCAGSLLGVAMKRKGNSFPVGKVDFLSLFPVSFSEFLAAYNENLKKYLDNYALQNDFRQIPEIFHNQLIEAYKVYLCCGGMPETIVRFLETKNWNEVDLVNNQILTAYSLDFSKHINSSDIPRVHKVWQNLQDNLAKEDRKFRYSLIEKNARAREYENAIEWLVLSGLLNRVFAVETPKLPLSSYSDSAVFKLYLLDSGLLRTKFRLNPQTILQGNRLFEEFKGVLTENYILQSLVNQFGKDNYYWTSGNTAEIDFLLETEQKIVPVEVKSALSVKAKSLSEYRKKYQPELSVRFSLKNVERNGDLLNLPLYLVDYFKTLILSKFIPNR
jgi:predicted AAA+ superfamily ATPase